MKLTLTTLLVFGLFAYGEAQTPIVPVDAEKLYSEIRELRAATDRVAASVNALANAMSKDGIPGQPPPEGGPVLHLVGPDGNVVTAQGTADGRLKVRQ